MVYVHVPFCRSFCTYCDFYSEIACRGKDSEAVDAYVEEIVAEARRRSGEIEASSTINTLYFGGGTPSVLPLSAFRRIVDAVGRGPYDEFTVEVNPEDVVERGQEFLSGLRILGVNRISMGVQSLDDGVLRWMNRRHDADTARKAFSMLRESGFGNVSVDLITGVSGQTDEMLGKTLDEILLWRPEHISSYQLSVEEGSALAGMLASGRYVEMDDESCRRQYNLVRFRLADAGYRHYEISNWALPGREAVHNSAYWTRKPYVGLGPGAHSLVIDEEGEKRSWNSQSPAGWTSEGELLSPEEIREERLMLGLRTSDGVDGRTIPEEDWFVADGIIAGMV